MSLPGTQRYSSGPTVKPRGGGTISTTVVDARNPPDQKEEGGSSFRSDRGNLGEAIAAAALRKGDAAPRANDDRTIRMARASGVGKQKPPVEKEERSSSFRSDRGNRGLTIAAVALQKDDVFPGAKDSRTTRTARMGTVGEGERKPAGKMDGECLTSRSEKGKLGTSTAALRKGDAPPGGYIFRDDARGGTGDYERGGASAEPLPAVLPPSAGQCKRVKGREQERCESDANGLLDFTRTAAVGGEKANRLSGSTRTAGVGSGSGSVGRESADLNGVVWPQTGGATPRVDNLAPKSGTCRTTQAPTVARCVPTNNLSHLPGQGGGEPLRLAVAAAAAVDGRDSMNERAQRVVVASALKTVSSTFSNASPAMDSGSATSCISNEKGRVASGRSRAYLPGAVGTKPRSSVLRLPVIATPSTANKTPVAAPKTPANPAQGLPHGGREGGDGGFTAAKSTQSLPRGHGGYAEGDVAVTDCSSIPPEERFEAGRRSLYKAAGARRGRGRGRCGRGGGRGSAAPVPATGPLLGSWRTGWGKKGERGKR